MRHADLLPIGSKPAPGELVFVQGFVNTVDLEQDNDAFATPEAMAAWLERHGLLSREAHVSHADYQKVVAFRDAVRALLLANNGERLSSQAVTTLESVASTIPLRLHFNAQGEAELEPAATGVNRALGVLQSVIYRAMREGTWSRLKACPNDACHWAFYDNSRNRSGTWCTMEVCGNRMKVRAHRERKAQAEP